jgi:ribosomal-protein-alanine N-acetyltransferase
MSAVRDEIPVSVRSMTEDDLEAVVELERASYAFPWSPGIFRDCLRTGYHGYLAEDSGGICGYYIVSIGVHEGHLLNLCVDSRLRGRGLGRRLLHHAMQLFRSEQAATVFLEVRPSNKVAIALYESEGFVEIGTRKDYYRSAGDREDALVLARDLFFAQADF